jgi:hypothetical protein
MVCAAHHSPPSSAEVMKNRAVRTLLATPRPVKGLLYLYIYSVCRATIRPHFSGHVLIFKA